MHPNKPPNGWMQPNKQVNPKGQQITNPQRENKQEHDKEPRPKQTSMDLKQKAWKRANKAQTCIQELIKTLN